MAVQIRKRAEGEGKNAGEYAAATDFDGKVVAKGADKAGQVRGNVFFWRSCATRKRTVARHGFF
jgi:hypothetical protein